MLKFMVVFLAAAGVVLFTLASASDRIVGGHEVSITKHPHQISMRRRNCNECPYQHICGGSIYNEKVIVTAAHCLYGSSDRPEFYAIVAGSDNRKGSDGAIVTVENICINENYEPDSFENDVALMFLAQSLPLNNVTIRAIPLASRIPNAGEKGVVSGWGDTQPGGQMSLKLQEVELPIVDKEICTAAYGSDRIMDSMICAGLVGEGGKDSCQGDSGGPLLVNHELAGIVSWGRGCARPEFPGVYSNVFNFKNWIQSNVEKYYS